ncbi:VanZ family protein [Enterococcus sp. DIV0242_7C1]|uniref:VanZ family protein n=1 Tax=Candidatus Enterococcus dunnyi TaxID=1834192 RepID=A0A200IZZ1_9ENTE|nr:MULTISPECIES: VanZ family protein [unclassified Enterococcus]MBO0470093.1 VanZ family protein [Enterococcus sp. DIV0242_7C1]MCA5013642.1 VanZ family protein [Enterococcus sp. S23]MCA5016892.1 VanZ family protein [Enterococcus sp. S22(2020)]OUZ30546.1 VanZ family protein [Enterococcus sp. 9D6_DIV0238]
MKKQLKNSNLYIAFAFLIMAILFFSSSQTYEQQSQVGLLDNVLSSKPFAAQLKGISFSYAGSEVSIKAMGYAKFIEFFIRKGAHFGTYFLLGGSWFIGLNMKLKQPLLVGVVSWLAATGYAGLDEYHQMLTGGRSPLFQDVMLDSFGALSAVFLCLIVLGIKRLSKKR